MKSIGSKKNEYVSKNKIKLENEKAKDLAICNEILELDQSYFKMRKNSNSSRRIETKAALNRRYQV